VSSIFLQAVHKAQIRGNLLAKSLDMAIQRMEMPPIQVVRGRGGFFRINDGVTRATRIAKLRPGAWIPAEVIEHLPDLDVSRMPKVKDVLP
jgi:hypothetical protein